MPPETITWAGGGVGGACIVPPSDGGWTRAKAAGAAMPDARKAPASPASRTAERRMGPPSFG